MSANHTPGPWAVDPDDRPDMEWNIHIVQHDKPHITICFMSHDGDGINATGEANARLIAAAPDLLAALNLLLYGTDCYLDDEGNSVFAFSTDKLAQSRAAIAKATHAPSGPEGGRKA